MLTVIVHRVRLRLIGGNSCATTRSGNFYNNADAHQPKGKDKKYDYRHPGAIGRVSTPVVLSASSDTEFAGALVGTAIGSCALTGASAIA